MSSITLNERRIDRGEPRRFPLLAGLGFGEPGCCTTGVSNLRRFSCGTRTFRAHFDSLLARLFVQHSERLPERSRGRFSPNRAGPVYIGDGQYNSCGRQTTCCGQPCNAGLRPKEPEWLSRRGARASPSGISALTTNRETA